MSWPRRKAVTATSQKRGLALPPRHANAARTETRPGPASGLVGAQRESSSSSPESIRAVIVRSAWLAWGMPAWTYPEVTCGLTR